MTNLPPSRDEILEQLRGHFHSLFGIEPEKITPECHIYRDLDLDSIDAVDLVVHLQRAIGKRIKPEDFKSVRTIDDIVTAIEHLMQARQDG